MSLSRAVLSRNIARLFGKYPAHKVSKVVAEYLLASNRTSELPSIMRDIEDIRYRNHKIVEVTVVSTNPLTRAQIALVQRKVKSIFLRAKKVHVNFKIDDQVIGGLKLEFANIQLDMSVEAKIAKLRQLITQGAK